MRRLHEVLDRVLGLEVGTERQAIEEFERSVDEPLGQDQVERLVGRCSATRAPRRSQWWRRPAAIVPLTVLLVAATVPIVMRWSGRRSTQTLPYEQAIETVFDRARDVETRNAALGRIHSSLKIAFRALARRAEYPTSSGRRARQALEAIADAIVQPTLVTTPPVSMQYGTFASLTTDLESLNLTEAERVAVIMTLEQDALIGVGTMKWSALEGPRLARSVRGLLRHQLDALGR